MMKKVTILAVAALMGAFAASAQTETTEWLADETPATEQTQPAEGFHKVHNSKNGNVLNKQSANTNAQCNKKVAKAHAEAHKLALQQQNRIRK